MSAISVSSRRLSTAGVAAQVFADFVVLAVLVCGWMIRDARERRLVAWPFVLITLVAGSFGPLLYLVMRDLNANVRRPVAA